MSQYNENPYYPNGGAGGGGGYLTGGSPFGSANGSPGGSNRAAASHSLRPVTISQLLKATQAHTDAEFVIDDVEIAQITLVARVVSIDPQATNCLYLLDDCTGRIEARHWVDATSVEGQEDKEDIVEHSYIRVMGTLKSFGTKRYFNATHLRLAKDHHEPYYHILEVFYVSLVYERGPPPRPGQVVEDRKPAIHAATSAYTAQSHSAGASDQFAHLPVLQRNIVHFIMSQPANDEGVHVAAIARAIGGDAHSISEALDRLMDEGHVFSTIDESHFSVST